MRTPTPAVTVVGTTTRQPMRVAMALTGATRIADINPDILSR
jgi:isopentenyl diphosphate isomerase/L-lactate dehydrogenase-like FMN-dependent dehydrogenase